MAASRPADTVVPRREQILRAAAELFARSGFGGVSVDDIGAAVGISGPALYRHFPGKKALLVELLVGISEELLAAAREAVATRPPRGALEALVDGHVSFALDHPALITIQSRDLDRLPRTEQAHVRRLQREYVDLWAQTLRAVSSDLDGPTAHAAAHATFGLINSTPHSARLSRPAMAELLRRMALRALLAT
jgi:AcrR family transcriptional regulator